MKATPQDTMNETIKNRVESNISLTKNRVRSFIGDCGSYPCVKQKKTPEPSWEADMYSQAYAALHRAALTYREGSGAKFTTYAYTCIDNALKSCVSSRSREQEHYRYLYLDDRHDDGDTQTYRDSYGDMRSPNPYQVLVDKEEKQRVRRVLDSLPGRQGILLRKCFGIGCEQKAQACLAQEWNVTPARICQLAKAAFKSFRAAYTAGA